MSNAEIPAESPKPNAEERTQVLRRLCELQEDDVLNGEAPTAAEKRILDFALAEFDRDGDRGMPWREVMKQLRQGVDNELGSDSPRQLPKIFRKRGAGTKTSDRDWGMNFCSLPQTPSLVLKNPLRYSASTIWNIAGS